MLASNAQIALRICNAGRDGPIVVRQVKYLNKIVRQDDPAIKRMIWPLAGFKSFELVAKIIAIVGVIYMIHKARLPSMASSNHL